MSNTEAEIRKSEFEFTHTVGQRVSKLFLFFMRKTMYVGQITIGQIKNATISGSDFVATPEE